MRNSKMKKAISIYFILIVFSAVNILSGCGTITDGIQIKWPPPEKQARQSVSFVGGIHQNSPAISFDTEIIKNYTYEACYTYGEVSEIVIDGAPFVACNYQIEKPDKNISDSKRRQLAKTNASQILSELSKACGKTPECDPLSGISLSADALQSSSDESERTMIIFDSGLSTTSYLNFLESNLFDTPVDNIVRQLNELHAIPELQSIDVIWIGIGMTCGEAQDPLDSDHKHKLETLWEAILKAGGAESITFDKTPVSDQEYSMELPPCSAIPIESINPDFGGDTAQPTIPDVIKWDGNSKLNFKGDSAEFANIDAAEKELTPIAECLKSNAQKTIYIFGMTASIAGGDANIPLSKSRAQACMDILSSKGVPESQMTCVGLGQLPNQQRVDDLDEHGLQIEELAHKNRAVIIADSESELVDILLKCLPDL